MWIDILLIVLICILAGIALWLLCTLLVAYILFMMQLKRKDKDHWSRECSCDDPRIVAMYNEGLQWADKYKEKKTDVHVVNEGLNLYGEYYDLGYSRAAIILQGRTEGLRYSYYFAEPYSQSGYNVLVIDTRAHGESDGKYNCVGFAECKDVIAWAKLLHNDFGVKSVVLHGICIGAASAIFALTGEGCPEYIDALIADGMHPTFYESFKNHVIEYKKPVFPLMGMVSMWMKIFTGYNMKVGPIHFIEKYNKPLLMLHGRKDKYSLPEEAEKLYNKCGSREKEIVWFDEGAHSFLRYADSSLYDESIKSFLCNIKKD